MIYKVDYIDCDCDYDFFPEHFLADVIINEDSTTYCGIKSKGKAIEDKALADFARHLINGLVNVGYKLSPIVNYFPLNIDVKETLFSINGVTYSVIPTRIYSNPTTLEIPTVSVDTYNHIFEVTSNGVYYEESIEGDQ